MNHYLLIESRDCFESKDVEYCYDLAKDLAASGNKVTLYLIQNGVLPTRRTSMINGRLSDLAKSHVDVCADDFSLRERAIPSSALADGIRVSNIDSLVDLLMSDGTKAIWH